MTVVVGDRADVPVAEALVVEMGGEPVWIPEDRRLLRRADRRSALRLYLFSLAYLALLFGAMVADARL